MDTQIDSAARPHSPFIPVALLALGFIAWLGFQTWNLAGERSQLGLAHATQQPQIDQANKLRAALDTLAVTTQRLAGEGSVAARAVVDELGKRGVTINPAGAASAPR
ncbi:hypothetical protein [Aquabacterium sp.]|uniref:hypothetical protein n=1 Tax=Aquabacterium sp. TaxID=1872578 RepID=UPI002CE307BA|nr:hypothetical protein [Aquabacterium sp.]HSW08493.1 hypothetical protein [Aquabacterium sp.]